MLDTCVLLADPRAPLRFEEHHVVLAAAVWVGLLALVNVRERITEIGVFRALGKSSARIASLRFRVRLVRKSPGSARSGSGAGTR